MDIYFETEQVAYPFDSPTYPLIRVFNAPYEEGDCPVDTILCNALTTYQAGTEEEFMLWEHVETVEGEEQWRATIGDVFIKLTDYTGEAYVLGNSYEVRIYASDIEVESDSE